MKINTGMFFIITLVSVLISGCMFYPGGDDYYESYYDDPQTEEVMGEELSDVPKYEPSIRTEYHKMMFGEVSGYGMNIQITYYTVDDIEKVSQFYLNEMPKYDWKLKYQDAIVNKDNDQRIFFRQLEYIKSDCDDEICSPHLSITIESPEGKGYSLIHMYYDNSGIE
ncbi:MAG: hypothetical protein MIO93_04120 [ANME-2 cluster archaeon]|jgi:hypothetical protein|nr:hypothetical protein [ANME-2 cluster archaeon]